MNAAITDVVAETGSAARYARALAASKRAPWEIDKDLIRGRTFDFSRKFLPDGLSRVDRLGFLSRDEARLLSQVQGRTYAYLFGLVERFISAKMLEQSRAKIFGDQLALEGLIRFSNEEIKHQELFRRMEAMMAPQMPPGYRQVADPNDVARVVLAASTWSVLALTCHIELFVQSHYAQSIAPYEQLCPLFRAVFQYHWRDECQHVIFDELEWKAEHQRLSATERDQAVNDLIALVAVVDSILQAQAASDTVYFCRSVERGFTIDQVIRIEKSALDAYRWQYIITGLLHPHFGLLLTSMTTSEQMSRIMTSLAPIMEE
jgi:hypothetical protein